MELQLHRRRPKRPIGCAVEEQRRRIVFWECYLLDRFSSATLGRPFAIEDSDIDAQFPELYDADLVDAASHQSDRTNSLPPSGTAVFIHMIQLGQLSSAMYSSIDANHAFSRGLGLPDGTSKTANFSYLKQRDMYTLLRTFNIQLQDWRKDAPLFHQTKCTYETQEFFELSYQEAKFRLFRASIDTLPSRGSSPPEVLLQPCLNAACCIIVTFDRLRRGSFVVLTHAYAHLIFMTSLWLVFSVYAKLYLMDEVGGAWSEVDVGMWLADILGRNENNRDLDECLEILAVAGEILSWFADQLPDVAAYVQCFGLLKSELETAISRANVRRPHRCPREQNEKDPARIRHNRHANHPRFPGLTEPDASLTGRANLDKPPVGDLSFQTQDLPPGLGFAAPETFETERFQPMDFAENALHSLTWPWMEELDYSLWGCMWDTIIPWQASPSQ